MSRVDNEDRCVTELDGQARAYMELIDETGYCMRFVYRCMYFLADTEEQARQAIEDAQVAIHVELKKAHGDSIIFWRRRPEVGLTSDTMRKTKVWTSSMRLATSPPLSEEAWRRIGWEQPQPYDENCTHVDLRKEKAA
jgi:hypothetical protein